MKNLVTLLTILIMLAFSSCKSFDPKLLQPGEKVLNPRLPSMEKAIENNYIYIVSAGGQFHGPNPQDISTLFDKEISDKITDPYTEKKGWIILKINTFKHKTVPSWALYIPAVGILTGLPTGVSKSNIEVQIDILNANRRLLGSYKGYAETKMYSSLYKNNFDAAGLSRTTYIKSVKTALQEAKKNMELDVERLIRELE